MTPDLIWFCAPPSGGRAGFAGVLAEAARQSGLRAEDRSLALIRAHLAVRPESEEQAQQNVIRAFWGLLLEEKPGLIVDLSPIPSALIRNARQNGIITAYWLLENALDPAYSYWREAADDYDLFFSYQADAFDPRARYLPWGAAAMNEPVAPLNEILLHGVATPHRIAFVREFLESWNGAAPLRVVGPGWASAGLPSPCVVEDRRTTPAQTAALTNGRIVLVPLSAPVDAVPPRVWDTIAWGGTVIAERTGALMKHVPEEAIAAFSSPEEAVYVAREFLEDPGRRAFLDRSLRANVRDHHMLSHRIAEILEKSARA